MKHITVLEASEKWGVTERMVRYYCNQGLIPGARQEKTSWMIPEAVEKPLRKHRAEMLPPALARKLCNQQKKRNYHGMYDYTILNLTYSSCRMASCRLTRKQVAEIIKTGKTQASSEPMKISDLIEVRNHIACVDKILRESMVPLTSKYIKGLHKMLFGGTVDEQLEQVTAGVFRKNEPRGRKVPPAKEVADLLTQLIRQYEKREEKGLLDILDFHVQFLRLAPFGDGNGRVGRLIMFKECLRNDIMPFILDDKRRSRYIEGIKTWNEHQNPLLEVVLEAQQRYGTQIELQKLYAHSRLYLPANYTED